MGALVSCCMPKYNADDFTWGGAEAMPSSVIKDKLYVCGTPTRDDIVRLGVTMVLNLTGKMQPDVMPTSVTHHVYAFLDSRRQDLSDQFEPLTLLIHEELSKGGRVMVHCQYGVSRSVSIVIAYLMQYQAASYEEAFNQVKAVRPTILPNLAFASQLQRHELLLRSRRNNNGELKQQSSMRQLPSPNPDCSSGDLKPCFLALYLTKYCNVYAKPEEVDVMLKQCNYDAYMALEVMYGEVPRAVAGNRA